MVGVQTKHAYRKQPTIFQNKKRILLGGTGKEKLLGYYRNIGLGFMVPQEALRDHCHRLRRPPLHLKVQPQDHVCAPVTLLQGCPDG
uniref:Small ribosomal subunit protein uS17 N-terminal domain-containing protein n=1 Tax=Ursus americanus TaxID=9643 RepID=A0A452RAS0_URSAM